jgi:hypothetical protein
MAIWLLRMVRKPDCSPLKWWLRDEQHGHYPNLSKMASDILLIPAMSADPE